MKLLQTIALIVCLSLCTVQAQTNLMPPDQSPSKEIVQSPWGVPYPYSADDVWQRLKTIIETPPEKLDYKLVENLFKIKLTHKDEGAFLERPLSEWGRWYSAKIYAGINAETGQANFSILMFTTPPRPLQAAKPETVDFNFNWWRTSPEPFYTPMCISVELFKPVFAQMGWKGSFFIPLHGFDGDHRKFHFIKSDYEKAKVDYLQSTKCITSLNLTRTTPERK